MRIFTLLFLTIIFTYACKTPAIIAEPVTTKVMGDVEKFDFDINALDKDGLMGDTNGKVSVDFQFCIPVGDEYVKAVHDIDPDIKILQGSRGRNRCTDTQVTAIGTTHKPGHREILLRLSELNYIKKFNRVWYE